MGDDTASTAKQRKNWQGVFLVSKGEAKPRIRCVFFLVLFQELMQFKQLSDFPQRVDVEGSVQYVGRELLVNSGLMQRNKQNGDGLIFDGYLTEIVQSKGKFCF